MRNIEIRIYYIVRDNSNFVGTSRSQLNKTTEITTRGKTNPAFKGSYSENTIKQESFVTAAANVKINKNNAKQNPSKYKLGHTKTNLV